MPWKQAWVDPNTGATFPQSYLRVINAQVDPHSNQGSMLIGRWASQTTYSLGLAPIQRLDINVTGSDYMGNFAGPATSGKITFDGQLQSAADVYIGGLFSPSGAVVAS